MQYWSWVSRTVEWLGHGMENPWILFQFLAKATNFSLLHIVQRATETHPASHSMGIEGYLRGWNGRSGKLSLFLYLASKFHSLISFPDVHTDSFTFYLYQIEILSRGSREFALWLAHIFFSVKIVILKLYGIRDGNLSVQVVKHLPLIVFSAYDSLNVFVTRMSMWVFLIDSYKLSK